MDSQEVQENEESPESRDVPVSLGGILKEEQQGNLVNLVLRGEQDSLVPLDDQVCVCLSSLDCSLFSNIAALCP